MWQRLIQRDGLLWLGCWERGRAIIDAVSTLYAGTLYASLASLREARGAVDSGLAQGSADLDRLRGDVRGGVPGDVPGGRGGSGRVEGDITDIRADIASLSTSLTDLRGSAAAARQGLNAAPRRAGPEFATAQSLIEAVGPDAVAAANGLSGLAGTLAVLEAPASKS